jgi:hypothetical protein
MRARPIVGGEIDLESRAEVLEESRSELRVRAERAERELDQLRQDTG